MVSLKSVISSVVFAVAIRYLYLFMVFHGIGVHHNNHYPGKCRLVGIECGSEQIRSTVDGLAFITNGMKGENICNRSTVQGKILLFDFNLPDKNAMELEIQSDGISFDPNTFSPHGMDIYDNGQTVLLYVVSHVNDIDVIEKFVYKRSEPLKLQHVKTIGDEKFICLNDVTVVGEDEFYTTNWRKLCKLPNVFVHIEITFQLKTANIVYYKNGRTAVVAKGPGFNGITLSKDKTQLLTASCNTAYVYVFDILTDATLSFKTKIFTGNFPDNIYTDVTAGDGVYYVGVLRSTYQLGLVSEGYSTRCSGTAIQITTADKEWNDVNIVEVFHDDGVNLVKGVSAAVHYKGQYLFGTVFHRLAYCVKDERRDG